MMRDYDALPDYLQPTYNVLICAFPDGVGDDEYWPLLSVLHKEMSFRNIADVLSVLANKIRIEVYNDASGFGADAPPPPEKVEEVELKSRSCGWYDLSE